MKRLVILGSTGSIGEQALDVVRRIPGSAKGHRHWRHAGRMSWHARPPSSMCRWWQSGRVWLLADRFPPGTTVHAGAQSLEELASHPDVDLVLVATVGRAGLLATLAALRAGKTVALANKEVLVMAGDLVIATAKAHGGTLIPVDSEHSALWQCLVGEDPERFRR